MPHFVVEGFSEGFECELGCRIRSFERRGNTTLNGAHVDNDARPTGPPYRQDRLNQGEGAEGIGLEHGTEMIEWHLLKRRFP